MTTSTPTGRRTPDARVAGAGFWPVLLCWVAVALDGFDLVVLGAVIPTLSATGALGFTDASLTTASTIGLVGVGIGAVLIGPVTDRFGRRSSLITCVAWFSVLTIAVAFAPSAETFIVLRFLAGLGLGACLPTALAFMSEHAREGRGGSAVTRMMTGYHVGAVLTALLALWLVDEYGWESMFVVGGVFGLLTVPLMWAKLPESETYLAAVRAREQGVADDARQEPRRRAAAVPARLPRPVGGVVHGSAARLRPQHLAAQDHGRGRLLHQGRHRRSCWCSTSARSSGCSSPAASRTRAATSRPCCCGSAWPPRSSRCSASSSRASCWSTSACCSPASSSSAPRCSSTPSSATSTRRRSAGTALGHGRRASAGSARSSGRPRGRPRHRRHRLPVGLLLLRGRGAPRRGGAGHGARAHARAGSGEHLGLTPRTPSGQRKRLPDSSDGRQQRRPWRLGDEQGAGAAGRLRRRAPPAHADRARRARRPAAEHDPPPRR